MEPVACVCVSSTRHFASTSCNCLFWPIYLAPHADEENAVAVVTLKKHVTGARFKPFEGRSGHAYALVKPKAGGSRDFEFANYPVCLIVARD